MPDAPDFRLYHSNSLEVLAALLAEALRAPAPGQPLLAPDIVLIPQVAMRRWLQATLAQAHGIAANLEFLTPGELVRRALDANVPGAGDDLDAAALQWRLHATLTDQATLREPALQPLRRYLDGNDPLKPWTLAGELAAVFEKYQAWRRDWLLGWEAGEAPRDPQAALWRKVGSGRAHRARRIDDYLRRFAGPDAPLPAGLPTRLFAFATLNISPDVLRVVATQARVGELHFYMPSPTRSYWGDLQTLAERLRAQQADPFAGGGEENPLLQQWGEAGRDFVAVLGSYEVVHPSGEVAAYDDPETRPDDDPASDTLLQRLQRDLLHRRAPPPTPWRAAVDLADHSLQVHACHTRLREVQVLHDRLRGLLEDSRFDPPLQPREIAVLAPDIDPYAPYIDAVFGGRAGHDDFIPYALADASPLAGEPLAEVFLRLLALPVSRFGLNEILDLLSTPVIADAAGFDPPALQRLHHWLQAAGARWGIDAAHRERSQAPRDDACTWAFALDRLLLGHASGDDADIAGVAPYSELEGSGLDALDALIRLLRVLARHERMLAGAIPPNQWRARLLGLLDALLPTPPQRPGDQRALDRLRVLIGEFADGAAAAGFDAPVASEVVRAHFGAVLAEADTRAPLLTGGISFGRMVPMRLLPFRAICVLGMNDGDYPRRDPAGGLNQLTAELGTDRRRRGDRSLRDDDRFLFLQLLASAGDVFYLSFLGADARDGSAREPSVLVSELLDVAASYHADPATAHEALVLRHPLQPFSPAAFGAGSDPRHYSYRSEWHPAADRAGGGRKPLAPWSGTVLAAPAAVEDEIGIAELRRFLRDPAGEYLRRRLAMRLPDPVESVEDVEPLLLPARGLERVALQDAVLRATLDGDTADLATRLRARGLVPTGPLAEVQLAELRRGFNEYVRLFEQWRGDAPETRLPIDLQLDGVRIHGHVEGVWGNGLGRIRPGEPGAGAQLRDGLDWLLANASGQPHALVRFHDVGNGPEVCERAPLDPAAARDALRALLQLRQQGLNEPLPWGPYTGWTYYNEDRPDAARRKARERWEGGHERWGERDGEAFRLTLRGRDLFDDAAVFQRFEEVNTRIFRALVEGRAFDGFADDTAAGRSEATA
ncbi:exodeoxyribonuclease V subunit gamma [Lysobacter sp. F60174L2]|uniref:exodeoxyribonuclease V subunit gamma n=1 Tax=Lysobacter sp. F60174L2 TaxID=3459295 RepID=UPI00403DFA6E